MENVKFNGYDSIFSTRLRGLLEENHISKQALSEAVNTSRQAVSQYCDGKTIPNADKLTAIANYFNVTVDYLVGNTDKKTPSTDITAICEYTGLSSEAVENLHKGAEYKEYENYGDIFNVKNSEEIKKMNKTPSQMRNSSYANLFINYVLSDDIHHDFGVFSSMVLSSKIHLKRERAHLENIKSAFLKKESFEYFDKQFTKALDDSKNSRWQHFEAIEMIKKIIDSILSDIKAECIELEKRSLEIEKEYLKQNKDGEPNG